MEEFGDSVLEKIHSPRDVDSLSVDDLRQLAKEIRNNPEGIVEGLDRLLRLHLSSRGLK